uniref:SJCHGC03146 protein n=1 Tax=Schistosoma japonicum TaxID=6182 RepID=Q5BSW0_SCHJA|nr:SJCHGC03146 protein [Schistosoma japonicum]
MLILEYNFTSMLFTFHHKDYSANVLEEVNRCGVTLEQFFTELESKENHTRCTEPENIKEKDLRNLQSIIWDQKTDLVDINVYELRNGF